MIDPERIKRWAVESLKAAGHKAELSPQAVAVVDALAREIAAELAGAKPTSKPSRPPTPTRELTDRWCAVFKAAHGREYTGFAANGAKDGQAAKRLLATGIEIGEIIAIACAAWRHPDWFNCKQAATLAGFACRFEDIRAELANPPPDKPIAGLNGRRYAGNPHNIAGASL